MSCISRCLGSRRGVSQWHEGAEASGGLSLRWKVHGSSKRLATTSSISWRPKLVTGIGSPRHREGRFELVGSPGEVSSAGERDGFYIFFAEKLGFGRLGKETRESQREN